MTLHEWTEQQGLTSREASVVLGVSRESVNQLRRQSRIPSLYLALLVEKRTGGAVKAWELLPKHVLSAIYGKRGRP